MKIQRSDIETIQTNRRWWKGGTNEMIKQNN